MVLTVDRKVGDLGLNPSFSVKTISNPRDEPRGFGPHDFWFEDRQILGGHLSGRHFYGAISRIEHHLALLGTLQKIGL